MRGVRWLGPTARIVSFSSEKAAHGYRNTLLLTDIRNRSSLPFREVGAEGAPMLGIRASPLGRYILILLRGAPSEIWLVSATKHCHAASCNPKKGRSTFPDSVEESHVFLDLSSA